MKLINNARQWYKLWSIRLSALGAFLLSAWLAYGNDITAWWMIHGAEYFPFLAPQTIKWIGLILVILGQFARLVKQPQLAKEGNIQ
ncbi:hypothetical protein HCY66_06065 [Acinetobacter radioresistens]|uniref:DUF7940 domain-containing protein n=1 Tax=Acinetobacter radioresistens TaxID=40216 RepID=UPI0020066D9E|nr:hypothetical protein [Acinetobacter radioresistens]MCK4089650.1 hypothetical protein [Acinetobacter radioresistens]